MPEYRQNRSGTNWVVERSWDGVREDLEEHERHGEDAAAFIVRTSSTEADEARADEHSATKTVFLAQESDALERDRNRGIATRLAPTAAEAAESTDAAAAGGLESGRPQAATSTPPAEEAPTPDSDATPFADDAPVSGKVGSSPDEVPESASEPQQEEAARKENSMKRKQDNSGVTMPIRFVVVAAVLVAAVIAGSLFVLQSRSVEPPWPPEHFDEASPPEDPDQITTPEEVPGEPVVYQGQSAQELPVPRPQAENDASRRALERQFQALQARLAALEDSSRTRRSATPDSEPPAADVSATPANRPTPTPREPEPRSRTPQGGPPPPAQATPDPDATSQALLQQIQSLQQELTRLTRLEASDTGGRTQPETHPPSPPDERPPIRTGQQQPPSSETATPPAAVPSGGTPTALPPQASDAQPAQPAGPVQVSGAVTKPVRVDFVEPSYPRTARRMRVQGSVVLRATIDKNGEVTDVEVLKGLSRGLTEAAVAAVKQWKYKPATLNGKPVAVYYNLTIHFRVP